MRLIGVFTITVILGCAGAPVKPTGAILQQLLPLQPRTLWIAAHPDDEIVAGGPLAALCVANKAPCHFLVFNRGRGGECYLPDGCPDLGAVRHQELKRSARLFTATLENYDFFNAPLPLESFPTRQELQQRWQSEGDPRGLVARAIRRFKPEIVITFDAEHGFTGHPEHQAAARFALAGIRDAADASASNPLYAQESPHKVSHVFHVLNKYWFMGFAGDAHDQNPHDQIFDADQSCGRRGSCADIVASHSRAHQSQDGDMRMLRAANKFWGTIYLRHLDPFGDEATQLISELVEQPDAISKAQGSP